jgi:hypothetical protein
MEEPKTAAAKEEGAAQRTCAAATDPGGGRPERRRSPRRRALKSARILFNDGHCSMSCHILDTSETGALIMPADILSCPDHFILEPLSGPPRACELVWRKGTKAGIRYL